MRRIVVKNCHGSGFEGLAEVTKYFVSEPEDDDRDVDYGSYCVVGGRYRVGTNHEAVAIAIGFPKEVGGIEPSDFSVLAIGENATSLPTPFEVKGERKGKTVDWILSTLAQIAEEGGFEEVLKAYKRFAKEQNEWYDFDYKKEVYDYAGWLE